MLSIMVMWGKRLKCWNTMPIFWRCSSMFTFTILPSAFFIFFLVMSTPSKRMEPPVGSSSRFRLRRNVDLPEPEGPMTTTTSPRSMSTVTPSRALMAPLL